MQGNEQISGADVRWKQYRNHMTEYILKDCKDTDRILILGAGGCDDIDLAAVAEHTALVCLADVNREAMEAAVGKLQSVRPDLQSRIFVIETDFLPISEEEYGEYDKACRQGIETLEQWWVQHHIQRNADRKRQDAESSGEWSYDMLCGVRAAMQELGQEAFDTVICLGLHSQLYVGLAVRTYQQKEALNDGVRIRAVDLLQNANQRMAEQFMQEILQVGKRVILGLEHTAIYGDSQVSSEEISQQLMLYGGKGLCALQLPRVEGAYQIEQQIAELYRTNKIQIKDCQYFFWPFSEEKTYLMVLYVITYNAFSGRVKVTDDKV